MQTRSGVTNKFRCKGQSQGGQRPVPTVCMRSWKGAGPPKLPEFQMAEAALSPTCGQHAPCEAHAALKREVQQDNRQMQAQTHLTSSFCVVEHLRSHRCPLGMYLPVKSHPSHGRYA